MGSVSWQRVRGERRHGSRSFEVTTRAGVVQAERWKTGLILRIVYALHEAARTMVPNLARSEADIHGLLTVETNVPGSVVDPMMLVDELR